MASSNISTMLNITRTWNAAMSASSMRRAPALGADYAGRRGVFGSHPSPKPLHLETLAEWQGVQAAFLLAFRVMRPDWGRSSAAASAEEQQLFRRPDAARQTDHWQQVGRRHLGGPGNLRRRQLRRRHHYPRWDATRKKCSRSGKARRTCCRWMCCARQPAMDVLHLIRQEYTALAAAVQGSGLAACRTAVHASLRDVGGNGDASTDPQAIRGAALSLVADPGAPLSSVALTGHAGLDPSHAADGRQRRRDDLPSRRLSLTAAQRHRANDRRLLSGACRAARFTPSTWSLAQLPVWFLTTNFIGRATRDNEADFRPARRGEARTRHAVSPDHDCITSAAKRSSSGRSRNIAGKLHFAGAGRRLADGGSSEFGEPKRARRHPAGTSF